MAASSQHDTRCWDDSGAIPVGTDGRRPAHREISRAQEIGEWEFWVEVERGIDLRGVDLVVLGYVNTLTLDTQSSIYWFDFKVDS